MMKLKQIFQESGIDLQREFVVKDEGIWRRMLRAGSLGLGEGYMERWWESEDLVSVYRKLLKHEAQLKGLIQWQPIVWLPALQSRLFNLQRRAANKKAVQHHYDAGQELFERMLDKELMLYSCAFFSQQDLSLEQAQRAKMDLIARKLLLQPGVTQVGKRIIDYGCGWGGALNYFATEYGLSGLGITLSENQIRIAQERFGYSGIEFKLLDYRDLPLLEDEELYDMGFSIGAFEHFGYKNYPLFFDTVARTLKKGSLFLLHTIVSEATNRSGYDPFLKKYIFGNAHIPSLEEITKAAEGRLEIHNVHRFGEYYALTLRQWQERLMDTWPELESLKPELYTETYRRMWATYLSMCIAVFEERKNTLFQIVMSHGAPSSGVYHGGWA
jgi:cyclopropane-fatty-acyl-phospholipid synthase